MQPAGDLEFAYQLRDVITRYLAAIDAWERRLGQAYRLRNRTGKATNLGPENAQYASARAELEALVPRARLLYHRYDIREPFTSLLRVRLSDASPQLGIRASLGGNERTEIARGLVDLVAACASIDEPQRRGEDVPQPTGLARILQGVARRLF